MMNCTLRKINEEDVTQLQAISRSTFRETFKDHNTEEDLNKYLDEQLSIKSLLEELKNPNSAFYFAYKNEQIVGYLKLNWTSAQTELIDEAAFEIERIYILKEFFGTGLGQFLLNNAITIGKEKLGEVVVGLATNHIADGLRLFKCFSVNRKGLRIGHHDSFYRLKQIFKRVFYIV